MAPNLPTEGQADHHNFYPRVLPTEENTEASIISTIVPPQQIKSGINPQQVKE